MGIINMRNRYAGKCLVCKEQVNPFEGYFERYKGGWFVRCINCVGKSRAEKDKKDSTNNFARKEKQR